MIQDMNARKSRIQAVFPGLDERGRSVSSRVQTNEYESSVFDFAIYLEIFSES